MRILTMTLVAALLSASPLHAASRDVDTRSERLEQRTKKPPTRGDRPPDSKDYTKGCKEEARGLRGPERSRFMTKCLREH